MKIKEKINQLIDKKKEELANSGGPTSNYNISAEAEIIVRGPDGKIKSKTKANKTVINL